MAKEESGQCPRGTSVFGLSSNQSAWKPEGTRDKGGRVFRTDASNRQIICLYTSGFGVSRNLSLLRGNANHLCKYLRCRSHCVATHPLKDHRRTPPLPPSTRLIAIGYVLRSPQMPLYLGRLTTLCTQGICSSLMDILGLVNREFTTKLGKRMTEGLFKSISRGFHSHSSSEFIICTTRTLMF